MSDLPQNQEYGVPNGTVELDVFFKEWAGGSLVDPSPDPTYIIYDPNDVVKETGTGTKISTGNWYVAYSIPSDAEISNTWKIKWTATINGTTIEAEEYFRVISAGEVSFGSDIEIADKYMKEIKKVLAYPSANNIILEDDDIKELVILPALREYFSKFPIEEKYETEIVGNQQLDIDFPDINTFGVVDMRLTNKGYSAGTTSFWDIVKFQSMNNVKRSSYGGKYGTPYKFNTMGRTEQFMQKMVEGTYENKAAINFGIDESNRQINVYSEVSGSVDLVWAKFSSDFSKVKFVYINDVIKLAQANLLQHLVDTAGIIDDSGASQTIDTDTLNTKAEELRNSVMEKWNEIPDIILVRL